MEHISTNGRAGVIVPEGIIFQSANAYKALRKLLVDTHLFAVISLPSGIFQPYAGVKTSILLMDRTLAKCAHDILFVKIDSDGFDLGAQRRPNDKSDLTMALDVVLKYKKGLQEGKECEFSEGESKLAHRVLKTKIAESGDYNLSGERYKEVAAQGKGGWEIVELGDICETTSGGTPLRSKKEFYENGTIPWIKSGEVNQGRIYNSEEHITEIGLKNSSAKIIPKNSVLIAMYGATAGQVGLLKIEATTNQAVCAVLPNGKINPEFLYWILKSQTNNFIQLCVGGAQPNLSQQIIRTMKIPLPPLSVQQEIVAEIEREQNQIGLLKTQIEIHEQNIKKKIAEVWG
jgi:type I restriction enzyme M protein